MNAILLDTCAAIWILENAPLTEAAVSAMDDASDDGRQTFVSAITAWEVGMLVSRQRLALALSPRAWFDALLGIPGIALAPMGPDHLIGASFLPGKPPRDPADRILASTARIEGMTLMTRDRLLIDYGSEGHLRILAC